MPENLHCYFKDFEQPVPIKNRLRALLAGEQNIVMGLDINRFQAGELQDAKAIYDAGYRFVILETCWGLWVPPTFKEFWPKLLDAGLILLGYQFFRGDQSGSDQADLLLNTVYPMYEAQKFWMPLLSDIEPFVGDMSTVSNRVLNWRAWVGGVRKQITPGAYSNIPYWRDMMNNEPLPADCIGWPAHWTTSTIPLIPTGWTREQCKFHQIGVATKYSWCPKVPGLAGDVGVDRFYGTENELRLLGKTIEPPPPPPADLKLVLEKLNEISGKLGVMGTTLDDGFDAIAELHGDLEIVGAEVHSIYTIVKDEPPPPPPDNVVPFKITPPEGHNRVSARFNSGLNGVGKIIFQVWPSESSEVAERQTWLADDVIQIKTPAITGDNSLKCFEIYDPEKKLKFRPLYVRKDDGTQIGS